jgi:hypothetical protein
MMMTVSGAPAMRIPVTDELIQRSPNEIAENGTTNSIAGETRRSPPCDSRSGRNAPRYQAMGSRMSAAIVNRLQATTNGDNSWTAIRMKEVRHAPDDPQSPERRPASPAHRAGPSRIPATRRRIL